MAQENKNSIWLDPNVALILGTEQRNLEALCRSLARMNNGTNHHESIEMHDVRFPAYRVSRQSCTIRQRTGCQ